MHKHSCFSEMINHPLLKESDWVAFSHLDPSTALRINPEPSSRPQTEGKVLNRRPGEKLKG
ncbi:MAG: hypothetical protein COS40_10620 [Deltaproteobacteria bacterium CG03_land_8_20_14_0_80_45_14]|nr:MAG: hypothetical protein COS40_10620 [Deltaproteobacteria bacterium CG03_land_8_20_14_0_80_45_14]